ncbi:Iron uptake system component EfeO precursor [Marinomonas spartinae]|uniref:iron uptake system protein EfeO n=1 Tax=Marinomonas spartinae TaxID=1792290 RepID=UPI000808EDEE|nr:iron uptake system protein EfeO [Marinomonas spartinae]SBS35551.1 Iron uptake system component EfeO precursor [Marinomonas spartinae]
MSASSTLFKNVWRKPTLLAVTTGSLLASCSAFASDVPQYHVEVNDKKCQPMALTVPAGKVQFIIRNQSMRALEWEILDGVMVVAERENIIPGFQQKMTVTLEPGTYEMTCGLLTNPHGKLTVQSDGQNKPYKITSNDFIGPIAEYKFYVMNETRQLTLATKAFTDAIRANEMDKAKALYSQARVHYERIEPIAELFSDLDNRIDAREDAFAMGAKDPHFTGFHRLEYDLWKANNLSDSKALADQLDKDVLELQGRIRNLPFPPSTVVGGAAGLIEEVASSKLSGEEDRYAHTDLDDFNANVEGAQKIVSLFKPMMDKVNRPLQNRIENNFKQVNEILARYKTDTGFEPYNQLSEQDRKRLKGPITELAEDLAKLRGSLGLN